MRMPSVAWINLRTIFVIVLVVIGIAAVPTQAAAQEHNHQDEKPIEIGDIRIAPVVNGAPEPHETIRQWNRVAFDIDWFAPNGIFIGQEFTIEYPEYFSHFASGDFPLQGEGNTEYGVCVTKPHERSIHCRLDEKATPFLEKQDIRGTVSTQIQATKELEARDVVMRFNGEQRTVKLPGPEDGSGVGVIGVQETFPKTLRKWGWYGSDQITGHWTINIPGRELVEWANSHGNNEIPVADTLGGFAHVFTGPPTITEYEVGQRGDGEWIAKQQIGNPRVIEPFHTEGATGRFTLVPPEGGWVAEHYYRVRYQTKTHDGKFAPDKTPTTNAAELLGKRVDAGNNVQRMQLSSATIQGLDRESFTVHNVLAEGNDPALVPPGTEFRVKAEILLPDQQTREETIVVPVEAAASGNAPVPPGTIIKLTELTRPEISGIQFGEPQFSIAPGEGENVVELAEDGKSITIRTVAGRNVGVVLSHSVGRSDAPFAVVKRTAGVDAARNAEYKFQYVCDSNNGTKQGTLVVRGDGAPVSTGNERFPLGATCIITEEGTSEAFAGFSMISEPRDRKRTIKIQPEPDITHADFISTYSRMSGSLGITKIIENPTVAAAKSDEEFEFEVSWSKDGIMETRAFVLRHGDVYTDFPKLPLGTKVTVKEKLPEDSIWHTPTFKGSVGAAVEDHGDNSATAIVVADDAGMLVTVTNSTGNPTVVSKVSGAGILGILGLSALLGEDTGSSHIGGNEVLTSIPRTPEEAKIFQQQRQEEQTASQYNAQQLARTGASVLGFVVAALLMGLVGFWLVRRSRRK